MSRLAAAPLLALALAACAVPEWQKPGTPLADIERTMGRPTLPEPLESGGQRLVASRRASRSITWTLTPANAWCASPRC